MVQRGDVIAACVQPSGSGRVGIEATASGSLQAQSLNAIPSINCAWVTTKIHYSTNNLQHQINYFPCVSKYVILLCPVLFIGFVLEINECAVNNGGCNQTCVDTDVGTTAAVSQVSNLLQT